MKINLSPVFSEESIEASVNMDSITINGVAFDFSRLPAGYELPSSAIETEHFTGSVIRDEAGHIELTLRFPHPYDASENMRFPEPVITEEGPV